MPIIFSRYDPDHKSIGEFLLSRQLRDAVRGGAEDVAKTANDEASHLKFYTAPGPDVSVTRFPGPRLSERVISDDPSAAAIEFGSGRGRPGSSGDRPQGGYNYPKRILGRAGAKHADRMGETEG